MTGMKTLEENIERLESAIKRAEEMSRECNSSAKAARDAKKDLDEKLNEISTKIVESIDETIQEEISKGLEKYKETLIKASHDGYDHVIKEFDKIKNIMMYGNEAGKGESITSEWVRKLVKQELAIAMRVLKETGKTT